MTQATGQDHRIHAGRPTRRRVSGFARRLAGRRVTLTALHRCPLRRQARAPRKTALALRSSSTGAVACVEQHSPVMHDTRDLHELRWRPFAAALLLRRRALACSGRSGCSACSWPNRPIRRSFTRASPKMPCGRLPSTVSSAAGPWWTSAAGAVGSPPPSGPRRALLPVRTRSRRTAFRTAAPVGAVVADGYWLPVGDGDADVVFSSNVLEDVPDPMGLIEEMIRVTRPGGLVYLSLLQLVLPVGGHYCRRGIISAAVRGALVRPASSARAQALLRRQPVPGARRTDAAGVAGPAGHRGRGRAAPLLPAVVPPAGAAARPPGGSHLEPHADPETPRVTTRAGGK